MIHKIIFQEIEVGNALSEMELSKEGLLDVVFYAASERSLCTENDPVGFGSYIVYAKAARRLREVFCIGNHGWIKDDTNNQAAILNVHRKIRIVPCNFNEFAGNKYVDPTNKSPKGEVSNRKTACNRTDWLPSVPDISKLDSDGYQNWVLGMYLSDDRMGAKLGLSIDFDGNYFTAFAKEL